MSERKPSGKDSMSLTAANSRELATAGKEFNMAQFGAEAIEAGLLDQEEVDRIFLDSIAENVSRQAGGLAERLFETMFHSRVFGGEKLHINPDTGEVTLTVQLKSQEGKKPIIFALTFPVSPEAIVEYARKKAEQNEEKIYQAEQNRLETEQRKQAFQEMKQLLLSKNHLAALVTDQEYELSVQDVISLKSSLGLFLDSSIIEQCQKSGSVLSVAVMNKEEDALRFSLFNVSEVNGEVKKSIRDVFEVNILAV